MVVPILGALFLLAAVVAAPVAIVGWRRRNEAPGFTAIALLSVGCVYWSLTDAALVLTGDETAVRLLIQASFPSTCLVSAAWWCLSYAFTDRSWRLSRRALAWLAVEPALCLVAAVTDPWHGLFIQQVRPTGVDHVLAPVFGPLFWVHSAYSFGMLGMALLRVVRHWVGTSVRYQGYLFALASSLPALAFNLVGLTSNGTLPDLTAIGFAITSPLLYWMVSRLSLPALAPIARPLVFEKINDTIVVVDREGRILDLNPAAVRMLTRIAADPAAEFAGVPLRSIIGDREWQLLAPPGRAGDSVGRADRDHTLEDVAGSGVDLQVRVSDLYDRRHRGIGCVLVARDMTELFRQRRDLQEANDLLREQVDTIELLRADLAEQAVRDPLTGLHNRRHLMTELQVAVLRAAAEGTGLAVTLIDIDHFKAVNDRYGHQAGDDVLRHVADLLAGAVHSGDLLARYGGEEFVLVMTGVDGAGAVHRIDSLRQLVRSRPATADGVAIAVTFSAGVALQTGGQSSRDLIRDADVALYRAKDRGRDRVERADEARDQSVAPV
jgi:diguanylate cyclase (GGDEF)-like protein